MSTAGWIILAGVFVVLMVPAILFINGKGAFLLAGYNTMSTKEKSDYEEKALLRFVGWLLVVYTVGMMLGVILLSVGISWIGGTIMALVNVALLGALIYANTGGRFKKATDNDSPENENKNKSPKREEN